MEEKTDRIFSTYKRYHKLISEDAEKTESFVYGIDQLAARLTVAHVIDDALDVLKVVVLVGSKDKPPTANKINITSTI